MKRVAFLIIIASITGFSAGKKMKKVKLTDGISAIMPKELFSMTPEDIVQRFPSVRRPIAAYTDENRLTDFSVKISATQWRQQDLGMMKEFFKASIINLYDKVNIIQEGITEVNGKQFVYFEFDSYVSGDKYNQSRSDAVRKYSFVQYTIQNGKTIVFSFNTTQQYKQEWQASAGLIMKSIKIKGSV